MRQRVNEKRVRVNRRCRTTGASSWRRKTRDKKIEVKKNFFLRQAVQDDWRVKLALPLFALIDWLLTAPPQKKLKKRVSLFV